MNSTESIIVYVKLPDEAVDVWAPILAERVSDGVYRLGHDGYDEELERWEFPPGSLVQCEIRTFEGGNRVLTAVATARPGLADRI